MKTLALPLLLALSIPAHAAGSVQDLAISAALDDPGALYNLGVEFYTGRNVPKDLSKSAKLWEKASERGIVPAKNNLGFLLFNGLGIQQDQTRAVGLWRVAADLGLDESQWHLGMALFDGTGIAKDRVLGTAWVLCAQHSAVALKDGEIIKFTSKSSADMLDALTNAERTDAVRLAGELEKRHVPQGL
jgi:hypothetical protein